MKDELNQLRKRAEEALAKVRDRRALKELEIEYFGRKGGKLNQILKGLKSLTEKQKKIIGQLANTVKEDLMRLIVEKQQALQAQTVAQSVTQSDIDLSQPGVGLLRGSLHPLTRVQAELEAVFSSLGFRVLDGPELESDYYNFTAVNMPAMHPARDMQDTFYIKDHEIHSAAPWVMRTQTSNMQVRSLQKYGAPLRVIVPGKCFRREATDVRHEHTFYQLEGVLVDKDISVVDLKGVLEVVAKHLYGPETQLRLRPKYFPFVEPGVNGDVTCFLCQGKGCRLCKNSGWLEILGAGLMHPDVLKEANVDPKIYSGFAFGFGLTRLVQLKYGIDDIRLLESGDLRFLKQF